MDQQKANINQPLTIFREYVKNPTYYDDETMLQHEFQEQTQHMLDLHTCGKPVKFKVTSFIINNSWKNSNFKNYPYKKVIIFYFNKDVNQDIRSQIIFSYLPLEFSYYEDTRTSGYKITVLHELRDLKES